MGAVPRLRADSGMSFPLKHKTSTQNQGELEQEVNVCRMTHNR